MDVNPVRISAQATVDAIDREIASLSAARESLVRLFGLGVRVEQPQQDPQQAITQPIPPVTQLPPTPDQQTPVNGCGAANNGYTPVNYCDNRNSNASRSRENEQRWGNLRQQVLQYLKEHGPTDRHTLRQKLGIGCRTNFKVMDHNWFEMTGRIYSLTPEGVEAAREVEVNSE